MHRPNCVGARAMLQCLPFWLATIPCLLASLPAWTCNLVLICLLHCLLCLATLCVVACFNHCFGLYHFACLLASLPALACTIVLSCLPSLATLASKHARTILKGPAEEGQESSSWRSLACFVMKEKESETQEDHRERLLQYLLIQLATLQTP